MGLQRQRNIFDGSIERNRKSKPKPKVVTEEMFKELNSKKNAEKYFIENQSSLPIVDFKSNRIEKERILPLLPSKFLKKGVPAIVTKHRSFKSCHSIDASVPLQNIRRRKYKLLWTDWDIIVSHNELLNDSLILLTLEGYVADKNDVLAWIFTEEEAFWHNRREKTIVIPFSFMACCALSGYDGDTLKECILNALPTALRNEISSYRLAA